MYSKGRKNARGKKIIFTYTLLNSLTWFNVGLYTYILIDILIVVIKKWIKTRYKKNGYGKIRGKRLYNSRRSKYV